MIHPVTVKNAKGKVTRIITSESLEERSKAICQAGDGHFASHKIREGICDRPGCDAQYWTRQRGKRYCSKDCAGIVGRAVALATKKRTQEKKRKAKEAG